MATFDVSRVCFSATFGSTQLTNTFRVYCALLKPGNVFICENEMISFHIPFRFLFCTASSSRTINLLGPIADFELLTQNSEVQRDKYSLIPVTILKTQLFGILLNWVTQMRQYQNMFCTFCSFGVETVKRNRLNEAKMWQLQSCVHTALSPSCRTTYIYIVPHR